MSNPENISNPENHLPLVWRVTLRVGRWLIYGLIDPRMATLFYIGKTHRRRELRLKEHLEQSIEGGLMKRHYRIREIQAEGLEPEIFVLKKLPPEDDWRSAELVEIEKWKNFQPTLLPIVYPPQTRLSVAVEIRGIEITN